MKYDIVLSYVSTKKIERYMPKTFALFRVVVEVNEKMDRKGIRKREYW